jgi:DNA-binding MarR family transcriptional regulator
MSMPQATPNPPQQRLDSQLCFAVHAAAHAFAQAYRPHLEPLGLTYPQYLVLLRLWEQDGPAVKELGKPLFLDSGTLTPLLKRMEAAGWLTRRRDSRDERVVRIHLTEKGRALQQPALAIPEAMLCSTGLSLESLVALRDTLKTVGAGLRGRG